MASTYSTLKIQLMATGENSGTWGDITNTNLGTALEEAIIGRAEAVFSSDADLTLTLTNTNTTQVARHYVLNVTSSGSLSAQRNLVVPTIDKPYIIENNTLGGQNIVVKTAAGSGVTVPNGKTTMVYADGVDVVAATDYIPSVSLGTALAVTSGGTGVTTSTGTGSNVLSASPALTGTPTAPTAATGTSTTQVATTAFVNNQIGAIPASVSSFSGSTTGLTPSTPTTGAITLGGTLAVANGGTGVTTSTGTGSNVLSASPALTGTPTAPTAGTGTNTTQIATTAFVLNQIGAISSGVTSFSAGTTGLTPSTGTTGNVTLGGTLAVANGGTGATSLAAAGITTLSGTQTITGAKTFSTTITGSITGNAGTVTNGVYITGTQTITGDKTFTGAFGIGTANPAAGTWAGYARSLSASNPAFVMDGTTSAGSICSAYFGGAGGGDTVLFGQFLYGSRLSNTVVGNISSTGTSTSYNTSSDRRLKKDITPMTDGLEKTMQLKPVDYVWVVNNEPSQGFIADELQQVIPEAVTGEPDEFNPDGTPKYQGIDTSFIVATLTNAIQQQQAIIDNLTSRIEALEAQ